ncbi:MAG: hypothetical protein CMK63_10440 [Pseudoalteromonadaceae bacterium]|nr:hypothetical protein [Pseudoalteromonadaceae bacterium]|tara:strand:- start:1323 stop:2423 length:1101 start_codon:yes stop_codon:yes gene_type:complete
MNFSDSKKLMLAQLLTPFFRLAFAFIFIPIFPEGNTVLEILIISEVLATVSSMGRQSLISSGNDHTYFSKLTDIVILLSLVSIVFYFSATKQQHELLPAIIVTTISLWGLNILSAFFLRRRNYKLLVAVIFFSYTVSFFSLYSNYAIAMMFAFFYFFLEFKLPRFSKRTPDKFYCGVSSFVGLLTQKLDMQLSVLFFGAVVSSEIFKLNALYLPLAIIVRIFSNTALITGNTTVKKGSKFFVFCFIFPFFYTAVMVFVLGFYDVNILGTLESKIMIWLSILFSCFNIPVREVISSKANSGNFKPLLILSMVGVLPLIMLFFSYFLIRELSVNVFIFSAYLLPRLLMWIYGVLFVYYQERGNHDKVY